MLQPSKFQPPKFWPPVFRPAVFRLAVFGPAVFRPALFQLQIWPMWWLWQAPSWNSVWVLSRKTKGLQVCMVCPFYDPVHEVLWSIYHICWQKMLTLTRHNITQHRLYKNFFLHAHVHIVNIQNIWSPASVAEVTIIFTQNSCYDGVMYMYFKRCKWNVKQCRLKTLIQQSDEDPI